MSRRKVGARRFKNYTEENLMAAVEIVRKGHLGERQAANIYNISKSIINRITFLKI